MELIVCAVRDAKSEAFGRPFFAQTLGIAVRSFEDEVKRADPENTMFMHPADFALYALGKFDDNSGEFRTETPKMLCQGNEIMVIKDRKVSKV